MNDNRLIRNYTSGPLTRQLLLFAGPFMLSNLLQTCYNLVDMVVVGQYVGAAGLSAVGIGGEIVHLYTFIGMGFCNAGQILLSQYTGLKNRDAVAKTVGSMFTVLFCLSLLITAQGLLFGRTYLGWLNVPPEAWDECLGYTLCCTAGSVFIYGYTVVSAILRGLGDSKHPMIFIALAALLNVGLDLLFVRGGMGAFGAALATVISQGVSFVAALIFLYRRRADLGFDFRLRSFLPDRVVLRQLLKLGFPMMLQSCAISVSSLYVSRCINGYGVVVSAVTSVGSKLSLVASIVVMALSQAGATMVGQNFAAGEHKRVVRILRDSLLIGLAFALLLSLAIVLWPEQIFSLFDDDPAVLAMSHEYVLIAVINFVGWAIRGPSGAFCNGLGFASMNLILGVLDGVVMRIGLCVLLGQTFGLGLHGYWLGSAIAGMTFFFVMFPYLLTGRWKRRRPPVEAQ